jgi:4'-phosphopantetheinyl transferase
MLDIEIISIHSYSNNCSSWSVLTETELLRSNKFLKIQDSLRFKLGRLTVRNRLSKELGLNPEDIPISTHNLGKPFCSIVNSLEFSISHSGSFVVVGWSDLPIGVDIEPLTSCLESNLDSLIFNSNEISSFVDCETNSNLHRLRLFVAKEAVLKCLGLGFSVDPILVELKEYEMPWKVISASYSDHHIFVKLHTLPSGYLLGVASYSLDLLLFYNFELLQ